VARVLDSITWNLSCILHS